VRRREFIAGGGAAAWAARASAQQRDNVRRVGILFASNTQNDAWLEAFKRRLAELGWDEKRNVRIDVHFHDSNPERVRAHAAELVASAPDVVVSTSPG
jgi:ABC-type uncharacterized transport system substrate-binding protein